MSRRAFPLLVLAAGLPVLAAAWAVLSPAHMVSSEMTWDLMFNLAGAWHLWFGHVPHVDFHEPVGTLTFLLTEAGFWLTRPVTEGRADRHGDRRRRDLRDRLPRRPRAG